eukprot:CAMPEP_0118700244 /NCGR_PEP_ID=MMETSP0800-20121206/16446_1 /TAXON_ID=210618 ORGANISM="Striatella unipunctata, Strain CCMP2910" /NCGR_SAMPLE_ID=MMETSP0800 /ASSEMBLY_ACC=CAM_ASM_000638 /LENGTH=361 /DNA_ID=CAMNT_0006600749 /DNA_START=62 /DNA_END=1147 /DNA_ORIENTATION=+
MGPFFALVAIDLGSLFTWSLLDPLRFQRLQVEGQDLWNTYGVCKGESNVSDAMLGVVVTTNVVALLLACWQAYLARQVSCEFNEVKYTGVAMFAWFQVLLISAPVFYLLDRQHTSLYYILEITVLFLLCVSMWLFVFMPLIVQMHELKQGKNLREAKVQISGLQIHEADSYSGAANNNHHNSNNSTNNSTSNPNTSQALIGGVGGGGIAGNPTMDTTTTTTTTTANSADAMLQALRRNLEDLQQRNKDLEETNSLLHQSIQQQASFMSSGEIKFASAAAAAASNSNHSQASPTHLHMVMEHQEQYSSSSRHSRRYQQQEDVDDYMADEDDSFGGRSGIPGHIGLTRELSMGVSELEDLERM